MMKAITLEVIKHLLEGDTVNQAYNKAMNHLDEAFKEKSLFLKYSS